MILKTSEMTDKNIVSPYFSKLMSLYLMFILVTLVLQLVRWKNRTENQYHWVSGLFPFSDILK
jgi:hypothetical protein